MELKTVHSSDAGVYKCCAMNDVGTACTYFTLAVNPGIYQYLLVLVVFFTDPSIIVGCFVLIVWR